MVGKTVSHYKIISKLGSGGMGEVYLAEDTKLERKVALKFLPPHFTSDKDAVERFRREAKAAARLNHANIVTIFEINEHNGETYIVMEYVDGISLREVIKKGPLPIEQVTDIATQICNGLQEAHKKQITHRDIKPENILIDQSGRITLLDFGLAQMKGLTRLTKRDSTAGTAKYISPEQYKGTEVDNRTDIFSLGVILFELLTGQWPFQGEYEAAILYSVLNEQPKDVKSLRPDVPQYFERIIHKCLVKEPEERFQDIGELLNEFESPTKPTATIKEPDVEKSIIVLPFENMSSDPEQEYFSDGLTEEIITDLSHIQELRVISRNSAMMLKNSRKETKTISEELNVRYVIEGSVRKAGKNVRITAQLIDAQIDAHLWADKYSGTLDDVFDIQEKVSRSIVDALKVKLTPSEENHIAERPIDNIQAYECWLKARQEIFRWTEKGLEQALQYLHTGIELIGDNIHLYSGMCMTYYQFFNSGIKTGAEILEKAEEYARKIFALDAGNANGFYYSGLIQAIKGNLKEAIRNLEIASNIDQNNADYLRYLTYLYSMQVGKIEKAEEISSKTLEIDPLTPVNHLSPTFLHWARGNISNAVESCRIYFEMAPGNIHARTFMVILLLQDGKKNEAFSILKRMVIDTPGHTYTSIILSLKYAWENNPSACKKVLSEKILKFAWDHNYYTWLFAGIFSLIDDRDEAIKWVKHAIEKGWINYPLINKHDSFLNNIRKDPRFLKLMDRVKYEWENFDKENPPPVFQKKSIIVLPFENMSSDQEQEYFSDGLTDEIISDLSYIHDLRVISRNSAMMLKSTKKSTKTIANELGVNYVLEGSVRKSGKNIRITAQLINAATDNHLWAERYDGVLEDVFEIQEKVSRSIVEALKLKLTPQEEKHFVEQPIKNVKAYECFLRARQEILEWTEESLDQASKLLHEGIKIIGDNPLLNAGLGYLYMFYFNSGINKDPNMLKRSEGYIQKAFQQNPDLFLGHYVIGFIHHLGGRLTEALIHLEKALEINPNNSDVCRLLSYIYSIMIGKPEKAETYAKISIEVDPLVPINYMGSVFVQLARGNSHRAQEECKRYFSMSPLNIHAHLWYSILLAWNEHFVEAAEIIDSIQEHQSHHTITKFMQIFKFAFQRRKGEALRCISEELKNYAWHNEYFAWLMTECFSMIDEKTEAINWLERIIDLGFCNYPLLSNFDPFLKNIRNELRFKRLMDRVKHEWENFEVK